MSDQQSAAPVVAHTREEFKAAREALSSRDVAVVMTMGALHDGHARLIQAARQRHDHVVVTIFLNPLQFGPKEDLSRYPRTFDADMEICRAAGVDVVFAPTPDVVYPDGDPGVRVAAGPLGDHVAALCDRFGLTFDPDWAARRPPPDIWANPAPSEPCDGADEPAPLLSSA